MVLFQVVSGDSSPIESKRQSSNFSLGEMPEGAFMFVIPDTVLQRTDEHIPSPKKLIGVAKAYMPFERPSFRSSDKAGGSIVGCLLYVKGALSLQSAF